MLFVHFLIKYFTKYLTLRYKSLIVINISGLKTKHKKKSANYKQLAN